MDRPPSAGGADNAPTLPEQQLTGNPCYLPQYPAAIFGGGSMRVRWPGVRLIRATAGAKVFSSRAPPWQSSARLSAKARATRMSVVHESPQVCLHRFGNPSPRTGLRRLPLAIWWQERPQAHRKCNVVADAGAKRIPSCRDTATKRHLNPAGAFTPARRLNGRLPMRRGFCAVREDGDRPPATMRACRSPFRGSPATGRCHYPKIGH